MRQSVELTAPLPAPLQGLNQKRSVASTSVLTLQWRYRSLASGTSDARHTGVGESGSGSWSRLGQLVEKLGEHLKEGLVAYQH